ncbi:hypothetical protein KTH06_02965 [Acinetobacter ursingii]|uniref:hypothetical protein n=1 Tax=Acinetobacter ursingii TaxID=108980 RepID=UPI00124FCBD0|nr:hypothetical protein [Acinetobacter ursingii]MCU4304795.1 hypothetical protein [Acinetobacter ursingii]MCU4370800.1 hypothetical protein [Acinetobacter ursingii]MDG9991748.1 hypothetical protein [Acinetobacter ursingii]MDH0205359.1 hypothetical protein [Acinetobacter ursingii]
MINTIKKLLCLFKEINNDTKFGKHKYVKLMILICFLSGFLLVDGYLDYRAISGDLPPHSPIIGIKGNFTTHKSKTMTLLKLSGDEIYPDKGKTYYNVPYTFYKHENLQVSSSVLSYVYYFLKDHSTEMTIVYGFILQNGQGDFYPIKITNQQGVAYPSNFIQDLLLERKLILRTLHYKLSFFIIMLTILIILSVKAIQED